MGLYGRGRGKHTQKPILVIIYSKLIASKIIKLLQLHQAEVYQQKQTLFQLIPYLQQIYIYCMFRLLYIYCIYIVTLILFKVTIVDISKDSCSIITLPIPKIICETKPSFAVVPPSLQSHVVPTQKQSSH